MFRPKFSEFALARLITSLCAISILVVGPSVAMAAPVQQLMVKLRDPATARSAMLNRAVLRGLSDKAGLALAHSRRMSGGLQVLRLPRAVSVAEANAVAKQLRGDPTVELVELDRWVEPLVVPNDARYWQQWHFHDMSNEIAAANLPDAWDMTLGTTDLVIAVVDTGFVSHADMDGLNRVLPGYDFVSDSFVANDGDGRDADASDPGNWVVASDIGVLDLCTQTGSSSWHGTHVAGTIGAASDNGIGVAGVNWVSKLLPVRVLGKCGGHLSDVLDGARWAAGISIPGAPANSHPARVINMSLGSDTGCSVFVQSMVNDILATGAVIVAAAGNTGSSASGIAPGNCAGVIAVAAHDRNGNRAYYSSTGPTVALSAPGGAQMWINDARGVLSLVNRSLRVPQASPAGDDYAFLQGTSMAAPHVAGVASLMLSLNPSLKPEHVRQKLRATARPFPAGSTCTVGQCGAGMLDAAAALRSAVNASPPMASAGDNVHVEPGTQITLKGLSSAHAPATVVRHIWTQLSGTPVTLADAETATPSFSSPDWSDTLMFQLTVIDDGGLSSSDTVEVRLGSGVYTASSVSGGEGGGGGCFIATAAYGSADSAQVTDLRIFRDRRLKPYRLGRFFVAAYYRFSPPLANAIRPYPVLRAMVRAGLAPYVWAARWFGSSTDVPDSAAASLTGR